MKNNAKFYRKIIAVIGIAMLVAGITRISRADDGRDFADKSKFTKIDVPGAAGFTQPSGINPQGDIVGTYEVVSNNTLITRGFLLSNGTFTNIDVDLPGAMAGSTNAIGINPPGDIVGYYADTNFSTHGFLLRKGTFTKIDVPGVEATAPQAINPQGDIVGFYIDSSGNEHGFLLERGKIYQNRCTWRCGVYGPVWDQPARRHCGHLRRQQPQRAWFSAEQGYLYEHRCTGSIGGDYGSAWDQPER